MKPPADRRYLASHEWARREADGTLTVGISDYAQAQLGDIVFVQPPQVGRTVAAGEACAIVESVKAAGDVHAPVAGEVIAVNAGVQDAPERLNDDPAANWIFRLRPASAAEYDGLLDAETYARDAADGA